MARRTVPPPGSARAIAAYNCGRRMADWGSPNIVGMMNRGESITDLLTPGEKQAYRLCTDAFWSKWWHLGYRARLEEADK